MSAQSHNENDDNFETDKGAKMAGSNSPTILKLKVTSMLPNVQRSQ